ncbi:hypothetical protein Z945_2295 [Sulfitobacter noctilucae]|nr:hypothetical protein Z945_2295 [Sulfitobacter noctilucae]
MEQNGPYLPDTMEPKEHLMTPDICIIRRVSRTIGADRGLAARGRPERL